MERNGGVLGRYERAARLTGVAYFFSGTHTHCVGVQTHRPCTGAAAEGDARNAASATPPTTSGTPTRSPMRSGPEDETVVDWVLN